MAELDFIKGLLGQQPFPLPDELLMGIGDDCAVVQQDEDTSLLYTMDSLIEGVHFDLRFHPLFLLGRKALAVNLSDIAGMGGKPLFALLSICLPAGFSEVDQGEFMAGFFSMAREFGVTLVGGDTVSGASLSITVTLIGSMATRSICFRGGAGAGDEVWVSGFLGESSVGLLLLQSGRGEGFKELYTAHLDPTPCIALGQLLADSGLVTSMMDISDGIGTDLSHICGQSSCGAVIHGDTIPSSAMMKEACFELEVSPLQMACCGGEDYELLFTIPKGCGEQISGLVHGKLGLCLSQIGSIDDGSGVRLHHGDEVSDISFQGYEHG